MEPENMSFIYMLKLSLNGENETAIYRQWFVKYRRPLMQAWLYIIGLFTVYAEFQY